MKKKLLTNKMGQVRELTPNDMQAMRPAIEVLPSKLVALLPQNENAGSAACKKTKKNPYHPAL